MKKLSEETKQKMRFAKLGKKRPGWHFSQSTRLKMGLAKKGKPRPDYVRKKISEALMGRKLLDVTKQKLSIIQKRIMSSPQKKQEFWDKFPRMIKSLYKRPTSLEQKFVEIIQKYKLPYRYTGNGDFILAGKNPDFVNVNGEKICIEVANRYHHPDPYKENRITHFAKWGWNCIIFFEDELDEKNVLTELGSSNGRIK